MIALQAAFGDDEHVSPDGAYIRALRVRKWLYIGAAGAYGLETGLYSAKHAAVLLKGVITLPARTLTLGLLILLIYSGVQYLILVGQLWISRREEWRQRFANRLAAEQISLVALRRAVLDRLKDANTLLATQTTPAAQAQAAAHVAGLMAESDSLAARIQDIEDSNPADRRLYRCAEYLIDALRLVVPAVVGGWAILALLR
jgi:hypothetical protein